MVYITKQGWYIYKKDDISAKLILKNGIYLQQKNGISTKTWYIYKKKWYIYKIILKNGISTIKTNYCQHYKHSVDYSIVLSYHV